MTEYERLLDEEIGCHEKAIALIQDLRLSKRKAAQLDVGARQRLFGAAVRIGARLDAIAAEVSQ